MNISRENIDELNAIVKVDIEKEDYQNKVDKILKDYRRTANIPGFRKGHVPMGLIKKQYGRAVLVDEVNKLLQENLNKYLTEEKLDVLGNPLPKDQKGFSWDKENYTFEFELGLAPEFKVDLNTKKPITSYKIVADEKIVNDQIEHIRKQYGKIKSKEEAGEKDMLSGVFTNEDENISNGTTFSIEDLKGKRNQNKFIGAKVDDTITLKTKNLFENENILARHLDINSDNAKDLDIEVNFKVTEVNEQELAELNNELFDKIFGKDQVKDEKEFREKLAKDAEKQFEQQSNQQLMNDVTDALIEQTKFELPSEFLQKWIQFNGEEELSKEEAEKEYEQSEKGLRFQLIENQLMKDNNITVELKDVMSLAKDRIKMQMAQFGQLNPSDEELENIAKRVLSDEKEARNMSDQVKNQKLLELYKEKANLKEKETTFDDFIEEVTKQNQ